MKKNILLFLTSMVYIFLMIAFCAWELNAANWPIGGRIIYVLFGTTISVIIVKIKENL